MPFSASKEKFQAAEAVPNSSSNMENNRRNLPDPDGWHRGGPDRLELRNHHHGSKTCALNGCKTCCGCRFSLGKCESCLLEDEVEAAQQRQQEQEAARQAREQWQVVGPRTGGWLDSEPGWENIEGQINAHGYLHLGDYGATGGETRTVDADEDLLKRSVDNWEDVGGYLETEGRLAERTGKEHTAELDELKLDSEQEIEKGMQMNVAENQN